jgi:hypothetical protein
MNISGLGSTAGVQGVLPKNELDEGGVAWTACAGVLALLLAPVTSWSDCLMIWARVSGPPWAAPPAAAPEPPRWPWPWWCPLAPPGFSDEASPVWAAWPNLSARLFR